MNSVAFYNHTILVTEFPHRIIKFISNVYTERYTRILLRDKNGYQQSGYVMNIISIFILNSVYSYFFILLIYIFDLLYDWYENIIFAHWCAFILVQLNI